MSVFVAREVANRLDVFASNLRTLRIDVDRRRLTDLADVQLHAMQDRLDGLFHEIDRIAGMADRLALELEEEPDEIEDTEEIDDE